MFFYSYRKIGSTFNRRIIHKNNTRLLIRDENFIANLIDQGTCSSLSIDLPRA